MILGFDAASWAGSIDMPAAYQAGMRFAWCRVGRGHDDTSTDPGPAGTGIDPTWPARKREAQAAGILVGGYYRFWPDRDLAAQIDTFASRLGQADGMLPPLVDVEDSDGLPPDVLTDWVQNLLKGVHGATGRRPMRYHGANFLRTALLPHLLDQWELCIANWSATSWLDHAAAFWQHKGDLAVPWATGRVDLQRFACREDYLAAHTHRNDLLYWFDEAGWIYGPRAAARPLPESGKQGTSARRVACAHTMVGYLRGTETFFARPDVGVESTFGVGGRYDGAALDGALWQWMSAAERAEANLEGNPYVTSWETSDGGGSRYLERWTPWQAETIAQSMAAWCLHTGRPAALIPDTLPGRLGLGYHRQGIDPWRVPDGDHWSGSRGKECPGDPRIGQYAAEVIPRAGAILASLTDRPPTPPPPPPEEADMYILRCDATTGTAGRQLVLVNGPSREPLATADRVQLGSSGVPEYNLTGSPTLYDRLIADADQWRARLSALDDTAVQAIAEAVAARFSPPA